MIDARLLLDDAVGETRRVLIDSNDRPFRIDVERWADRGRWARLGEIWVARLLEPTPEGDWRVDIGKAGQGVLRSGGAKGLAAGNRLPVRIIAEAHADKGPVVEPASFADSLQDHADRLVEAADGFLNGVKIVETIEGGSARAVVTAAIEEAGAECVELGEGGRIWIEATRALTAIDVDRAASSAPNRVVNLGAAVETGRQLALRGIGGLVLVDFIGAPRKVGSAELSDAFVASVRQYAVGTVDCLGLSRFGVLQAAMSRGRRNLAAAMACPAAAREALDALRGLEDLGVSHRAARLEAVLSIEADRWLRSELLGWEDALADRIGRRWRLKVQARLVGPALIRIME